MLVSMFEIFVVWVMFLLIFLNVVLEWKCLDFSSVVFIYNLLFILNILFLLFINVKKCLESGLFCLEVLFVKEI